MMFEVETYINQLEGLHKTRLEEMRVLLKGLMPEAAECIAYKMPAFRVKQTVCCYAACKTHIGFYPTSKPILHFSDALSKYNHSKGAIQFPLNEPFPETLITDIVNFRLADIKRNS